MAKRIIVIGGGAAGFFSAINCAEKNPTYHITILEKSSQLLQKVKISGGGRCNVTHQCLDPKQLVKNYPRGEKQLLGPFTRFGPSQMIAWLEQKGVKLKTERDGRMFPVSDSSSTIIDCFLREAEKLKVQVRKNFYVEEIIWSEQFNQWTIRDNRGEKLQADAVIITTGSSERMWKILSALGHTIVAPVPSLFTFNISDNRLKGLEGLSVENAEVQFSGSLTGRNRTLISSGPLLITHWGLSGPAVLKLSAWGARELAATQHVFELKVNWLVQDGSTVKEQIARFKQTHPRKNVVTNPLFGVPKRLWERLVTHSGINNRLNYADLSARLTDVLVANLTAARFSVEGKSTFKDEFVTAGGVELKEIDFKTMQSKIHPSLYFAGEVLDIDAVTGGFNFQAAWTTGWIAGNSI